MATADLAVPTSASARAAESALLAIPRRGVGGWITTVDHKRIGVLYVYSGLAFFVLGGLAALLAQTQLSLPDSPLLSAEAYDQTFTIHGTLMMFFVVAPLGIGGLGNYLVPLMIGARRVAFPRMQAFAFWLLVPAGLVLLSGLFTNGLADAGWTGYPPLSIRAPSGESLWAVSLILVGLSAFLGALNLLATIKSLRAPGMTLGRLPVFVWSILVASVIQLIASPVLIALMLLLLADRQLGAHVFDPAAGGDPLAYQQAFWFFAQPSILAMILPFIGAVSEVLPVFSRKPLFGYRSIVRAIVALGVLGFISWGSYLSSADLPVPVQDFFMLTALLLAVPALMLVFNWAATLWGGNLTFKTPLLFAVGFVLQFLLGGVSTVMLVSAPQGGELRGTYFELGQLHYLLVGGSVFGLFAGLYYWFPKMTGRLYSETLGQWHFWLMVIGTNLAFFPMYLLGLNGMQRRIAQYPIETGFLPLTLVTSVGAIFMTVAIAVFFWNLSRSAQRGLLSGNDPWMANSLEWLPSSPPPTYNFGDVPPINSERPLRDLRQEASVQTLGSTPSSGSEALP